MKVLWVVNTIFPQLSKALGEKYPIAGGWMYGLANDVLERGIELTVVTARPNMPKTKKVIDGITFYVLKGIISREKYDVGLEKQWKGLIENINPDVVHIHGTEYAHGLALIKTYPSLNYVVSIQGLIYPYTRYYFGGISPKKLIKHITPRDILKRDSIFSAYKKFKRKGIDIELEYLRNIDHFIGRTQWDHDHVKTINPKSQYHFCNESLRDAFYLSEKWEITKATEHTIFLSQAGYPLKGLHKALEAASIVKQFFPNIQLRVAGGNIIKSVSFKEKLKIKGYGSYIAALLKKLNLTDNITFTGPLNGKQMVKEYLKAHIFVCPSSIENSPNSLGEAQLLGVPSIASYVGGIPDMVKHESTGLLYRFEEVEMLAQHIMTIFNDSNLADKLSKSGIREATTRHNRENNASGLLKIYKELNT